MFLLFIHFHSAVGAKCPGFPQLNHFRDCFDVAAVETNANEGASSELYSRVLRAMRLETTAHYSCASNSFGVRKLYHDPLVGNKTALTFVLPQTPHTQRSQFQHQCQDSA